MDQELNGPTIDHLVPWRVSVTSKIRPAVSGSDDGAPGSRAGLRLSTSPAHRTLNAADPAAAAPTQAREQAGGSFMQHGLAERVPNRIHVSARLRTEEHTEHDGTGQRGASRGCQVPQSMVIDGGRWRDEGCLHDRQATAAS
ncbi:hypothetical protein [Streptomyces sp. 2A115]|uniref:hypothetical protein n=1 Tax=Streptomyces sp. 2A115 TaxID=3457439 RepID=UPI003FD23326